MAIKYLGIEELETGAATDPIWAINTASSSEIGVSGEVHIGIPKINGSKIDPLHIPQTWLAIELTRTIPRSQLLHASEFRTAIDNQLIQCVSAKSAASINSQEGADEERSRLAEFRRHVRAAGAARTLGKGIGEIKMVTVGNGADDDADGETQVIGGGEDDEEDSPKKGLTAGFLTFAERLPSKSDIVVLNEIKSRRTFSRKEMVYLQTLLKDKPKTHAAISKQLKSK